MLFRKRRKRTWAIILFFLFFVGYSYYLTTEPLYTPRAMSSAQSYFPRTIAHKSLVSHKHSRNRMEAIDEALKSQVEGMGLYVRISKEHVLFLYHGETIEERAFYRGEEVPNKSSFLRRY